jgi:RNA polymerase sigma factor (sigma-70 family)
MLGSLEDAQDALQDALFRAWRSRATYRGRSPFRAWLYRITTNACLRVLERRPRRLVPYEAGPAAELGTRPLPAADLPWLQPYPDLLLDADLEPGDAIVARETIELAFLAAIQHLPPRQRAVLILRDALDWSAAETAAVLETSVPAVNSALQRARATMKDHLPAARLEWTTAVDAAEAERSLLRTYMEAWERAKPQPPRGRWVDAATDSRKAVKAVRSANDRSLRRSVDGWWTSRVRSVVQAANESGPYAAAFAKPSGGLEPPTPSLPSVLACLGGFQGPSHFPPVATGCDRSALSEEGLLVKFSAG